MRASCLGGCDYRDVGTMCGNDVITAITRRVVGIVRIARGLLVFVGKEDEGDEVGADGAGDGGDVE